MQKNMLKIIYPLSILLLMSGCGGNGSSNDDNKTKKSIIDNADTTYEIVKGSTITINPSKLIDTSKVKSYEWLIDKTVVSDKKELSLDIKEDIGTHEVCLNLTYKDGTTKTSCRDIKVINSKLGKPTVIINNMPSQWKTKCPLTLDGSQSTAGTGGNIVSYEWFKDGQKLGSDKNQTYTFDTNTTHTVSLQVTDNENNVNKETKTFSVAKVGKPTVKLTVLNSRQRELSSNQSNVDITFPTTLQSDNGFLPYEGNSVFFSTHGSFDDCNSTDDNLTYIWDARIYKEGDNTLINHCFSQKDKKAFLANIHKDFNTTDFKYESFQVSKGEEGYEDARYVYPYSDPDIRDEGITQHEYVYIELCGGKSLDYNRLEIKLTAKDNLHNTQTSIVKTIEIKEANLSE